MKNYLVIGNPIEHSLSPKLHNYWINKNGINANYEKKRIEQHELKDLISEVRKKKIYGINITVPFKKAVIPFIDQLSLEAETTQSVNTVYLNNDKIIGHNTDIDGFVLAIKNLKLRLTDKKVLILGAGGVAPSIIYALNKMEVTEITISNRTKNKAEILKDQFKKLKVVDWGGLPEFDVIINATSIGLHINDKIKIDFTKVGNNKLFYDVIYNPAETDFLKTGKELGNKTENGKLMFIYQAYVAFKLWHGISPKINEDVFKLLD
jgi:shikimate dehydrogenase